MQRSIGVLLGIAALTTLAVVAIVAVTRPAGPTVAKGLPVPNVAGTTLDGKPFDLASLRGHPLVINFWDPSCVPCRSEFPLLAAKARDHAADGMVIVGVVNDTSADGARAFEAQYGATWSSVIDPNAATKAAYHVLGWPQTFFVDSTGILRSIQIGEVQDKDFERQYGLISGRS
jgi:cytochrome c biogenesis protein CcmG/thiol:disulfide interchange protein DsbE